MESITYPAVDDLGNTLSQTIIVERAKAADCPYPGLRPFRQSEAKFFCGRSQHRIELLTKLEQSRFVAVVGASGSGKSSLVMAGLLPDIADGMLMNVPPNKSRVVYFKPGLKPFASLAEALALKLGAEARDVDGVLRRSAQGIGNALDLFDHEGTDVYVVVADQFEELFRFASLTQKEIEKEEFKKERYDAPLLDGFQNEAQAFVNLLLDGIHHPRRPIYVVLTMRSDFLHRCEAFDRLPAMISAHQYLTPRLQRDQQADAIAVPLKYSDASIKPSLVNLILNDLSPEQDQLPVLQHALSRLWQAARARGDTELTIDDYKKIGGIANALNEQGEELLVAVNRASKEWLGEIEVGRFFRCLAEFDPMGTLVRRPRTVAQVAEESGLLADDVRCIADCFRADGVHWLMPMIKSEQPRLEDGDVLDLTHESLLRKWDRLAATSGSISPWMWLRLTKDHRYLSLIGWMSVELTRRDSLSRIKERMLEAGWKADGSPPSWLKRLWLTIAPIGRGSLNWWQLSRHARALRFPAPPTLEWGRRYGWDFAATRRFLTLARVRQILIWGVSLALLVTISVLYFRYRENRTQLAVATARGELTKIQLELTDLLKADAQRRNESLVRELTETKATIEQLQERLREREKIAEAANGLTAGQPANIFSHLREALQIQGYTAETTPTVKVDSGILARAIAIPAHEKQVDAVAFVEIDGISKVVSGAQDHTTKLWNLDGTANRIISPHDATSLTTANGAQLVMASADSFCRVWSPPDSLDEMKLPNPAKDEGVVSGQIISDGRVLFGTTAGRIGLWKRGEIPVFFPTQDTSTVNSLNYVERRQWVLASTDSGLVQLWTINTSPPKVIHFRQYSAPVRAASLNSAGTWAVLPVATKNIDLIHVRGSDDKVTVSTDDVYSLPHQDAVAKARFSPEGDLLATADVRGRIYLWSLAAIATAKDKKGLQPLILSGHTKKVSALKWDPNGRCLITADEGGTVLLWQDPVRRVETNDAREPFVLPGHQAAVTALAIDGKGFFVATGGADKAVRIAPFYPTFSGKCRSVAFGGPNDNGIALGEGLAVFDQNDVKNRRDLFLSEEELMARGVPVNEIAKLGTARRLKPEQFYVAARWDYSLTSRPFLRANKVIVRNPKTKKQVSAQPVDWGPNASTGGIADISAGLAKELGIQTDDPIEIVVDILSLPAETKTAAAAN